MNGEIHFHFVTLFPETISAWLDTSMVGRAKEKGLFSYTLHPLREFGTGNYRSVDDTPYGGGGGMILRCEPLVDCIEKIWEEVGRENTQVIHFSPAGKPMNQKNIERWQSTSQGKHLILVCGHYEGIDQRFVDHWVDEEISLGDFVLTGGELPALCFTDAVVRRLAGALGDEMAVEKESFTLLDSDGTPLLEYPHYTRPAEFRGHKVPDVLLSGDHKAIEKWRLDQARSRTERKNSNHSE